MKLKDGNTLYGRIIYKNDSEIAVAQNPFQLGEVTKAAMEKVEKIEPSQVSMMPPGTISSMNKEELTDLIAYLLSGGNRKHAAFKN